MKITKLKRRVDEVVAWKPEPNEFDRLLIVCRGLTVPGQDAVIDLLHSVHKFDPDTKLTSDNVVVELRKCLPRHLLELSIDRRAILTEAIDKIEQQLGISLREGVAND